MRRAADDGIESLRDIPSERCYSRYITIVGRWCFIQEVGYVAGLGELL